MMRIRIITWLLCCGLLLALSGCGNKGPLVLPEEEQEKNKSENNS